MSQIAKTAVKGYLLKQPLTWIVIAIGLFFAGLLFIVSIFMMSLGGGGDSIETDPSGTGGVASVSPEVLRWEPLVRKYAAANGIEQHTDVLLALIMQESGGVHLDVMQSSESLGLPPGTIKDPEFSIKVGVEYFAEVLKKSEGDIKLTLQSYNFGSGFIPFALDRGGYSREVAAAFSSMMENKLGWDRYGDINYVSNVLRYLETGAGAANAKGFVMPINGGSITSEFGTRFDPFTGVPDFHAGVDFSCQRGQPIYAAKGGTIERAGWQNPSNHNVGFGQRIYVNHGGGITTIYAHLSQIHVKPGQKVKTGQQIGSCGTTGSSTGNHLHLELIVKGEKVNALPYIQ